MGQTVTRGLVRGATSPRTSGRALRRAAQNLRTTAGNVSTAVRDIAGRGTGDTTLRRVTTAAAVTGAVGMGTLLYANRVGLTRFTVRQVQLPLLPAGSDPIRLLHISDIHYVPGQQKKFGWLQSLADFEPNLVINTGDNLSHPDAVDEVLEALAPLLSYPGVFVPGSNDYYGPQRRNPLRYLLGPSKLVDEQDRVHLQWKRLFSRFGTAGWVNLTNRHHLTTLARNSVSLSGVDDPHIDRAAFSGWPQGIAPGGAESPSHGLRVGVAHAPVSDVLRDFADTGADLILAGHTHGGQVCLPGGRALVTNCDLPRAQARGLSYVQSSTGRLVPLHVSAGIGTSAKAPIRFNCPPEATIIDLFPR